MISGGSDEGRVPVTRCFPFFRFSGRRGVMDKYLYDGPVMEFGRCVQSNWKGETLATSETKALSNLSYQWKKRNNRIDGTRITLPGRLRRVI